MNNFQRFKHNLVFYIEKLEQLVLYYFIDFPYNSFARGEEQGRNKFHVDQGITHIN